MDIDDIIKKYAEDNPYDFSYEEAKAFVNQLVNAGAKLVQENNTLFFFRTNDDGECEFDFLSADEPSTVQKNIRLFLTLAKKIGFDKAVTDCDTEEEFNLVKRALSNKYKFSTIQNSVEVNL